MPKRILIAEDQMVTREALITHAKMRGYDVVAVNDGVELLTVASEEKFDVVITDLIMPGLNGAAATEIMKLQGSSTPVIALTGLSPEDITLVRNNFTRIYHKPIDNVGKLFEYIESLLS
jgi:CheY-like chemotaxis protein